MKRILDVEPYGGGFRISIDETLFESLLKILENAAPKVKEGNKQTETYTVSKALF